MLEGSGCGVQAGLSEQVGSSWQHGPSSVPVVLSVAPAKERIFFQWTWEVSAPARGRILSVTHSTSLLSFWRVPQRSSPKNPYNLHLSDEILHPRLQRGFRMTDKNRPCRDSAWKYCPSALVIRSGATAKRRISIELNVIFNLQIKIMRLVICIIKE